MAGAAAAMFMPWHTVASQGATETVRGVELNEGQLVLVVGLVTVGLVQVGWRPAWIGAGFVAATALRAVFDDKTDPAAGLWIAAAASVVATALLVWDMVANVAGPGPGANNGKPGGRGLSGPLGRRR